MALHIQRNDQRSQLQEKIAAELQEKAKKTQQLTERPDGVSDSNYMKDSKQTTSLAWAWALIGVATVGVIIWLVIESTRLL